MWNRESEEVPVEESPLTAARRNVLQRQDSPQPTEKAARSFWSLLGRKGAKTSHAKTRAERRAERWERHRNFERVRFEVGDGEDPEEADTKNALGSTAYLESLRMQRMVNSAQNFQPRSRQQISPIAKHAKGAVQKQDLAMEDVTEKALNLEHWFDSGLHLGEVLQPKKMPPAGYEVAAWSEHVPFLKHLRTGVVLWPVRFNLLPFFEALEGQMAYRRLVTVYHYTTGSGFNRIVARFDTRTSDFPAAHDFAEELWDRLVEDAQGLEAHGADIPDDAFVAIKDPPDIFTDREKLCRAACRLPDGHGRVLPLSRVSYCIALHVPEDRILSNRQWKSTVFVAAPGSVDDDDFQSLSTGTSTTGEDSKLRWLGFIGDSSKNSRKQQEKLLAEVKVLGLLDGLVDPETGDVLQDEQAKAANDGNSRRSSITSAGSVPTHDGEDDQEKKMVEERIAFLEKELQRCERKQRKASADTGGPLAFFDLDPERIKRLSNIHQRLTDDLSQARAHLRSLDDEETRSSRRREALLQAVTDGKASSAGAVKAKRHGPQFSEFAADTRDTICHMGDEYKDLKGDILRDMLGGSVTAARTWLESKGDPDTYHAGTGWTPLLMAVSTGNMELVELLISYRASLTLPAKGSGETCVHLAVYKTTSEMLHKVLDVHGPATKEVRNDGSTALSLAVEKAPARVKNEFIRALLEKHSDPNVKRKDGWTPLGLAVRSNLRHATKSMVAAHGAILTIVPDTKPPLTLWELAAPQLDLQKVIRMKLPSKDLSEIEKRWPGTLLQMVDDD
ncbi:ANKK1 [Symbiodinium necroappetens]|uniref:ANKK1 protein n=1 Tax=Symbiodinium necroappetens TaxID=1628268 RepID=A0A812IRL8_9DINO|nr:ANKK1 [Symbiodinium necroappetens]